MSVTRRQFESWLMEMENAIAKFVQSAPPEIRKELDGSDESLAVIEQWILSKYASPKEASASESDKSFVDGAARYVGEIFRKNNGSEWCIELENPKMVFFGLPTLTGGTLGITPLCPHTMVTTSADRRTGMFFETVLRNVRQRESWVQ